MSKAIFLDRDGTIIEEVNYLKRPEDIRILPGAFEALRKFKKLGFLNIIITNQSGIARGYFNEEDLGKIHTELRSFLKDKNEELIDDIFFSPFHKDGVISKYSRDNEDRKPNIGMIRKAVSKHKIDLTESIFIGDSFTDMLCAHNAGLRKILVGTGYGKKDHERCKTENIEIDYFARDLNDALQFIQKTI